MASALIPINTTAPAGIAMDIVFVHGLNGHWKETWEQDEYTFWPSWIVDRFPMCRLWSFDYPAAASGWLGSGMALVDRANNFRNCLETCSVGTYPTIFITHSLGGLVTKALLRSLKDQEHPSYPERILSNLAGIVFLGTPHHGSFWATAASAFPAILQPTFTTLDLQSGDRQLADLNTWFRTFATDRQIPIKAFSETKPTAGIGLVVDQVSADPGIPRMLPVPIDADHISICKFESTSNSTYLSICKFIEDRLSDKRPTFANQSQSGLSIHLGIDNSTVGYTDSAIIRPPEMTQRYKIQRKPDSIRVFSDIPYIDRFSRGGPVKGYEWTWTPFAAAFPALDFKVANNGSEVVFISEAEFTIEHSRPMVRPVLVFRDNVYRGIMIDNEGSATAKNVRLRFEFQSVDEEPDFEADYRHEIAVPDIVDQVDVDLADQLENVDSDYPVKIFESLSASVEQCGSVMAVGQILWNQDDHIDIRSCDFSTRVLVRRPGLGLPGPPSCTYDLQLKSDSDEYSETVPVSHYIRPGETDRFQIVLYCDLPSTHRFRICLRSTADVVFESPEISLDYFIASSGISLGRPRKLSET